MTQLPNIPLTRLDGQVTNLQAYAGKVLLIVNVASQCGFTGQYKDLQALYQEFQPKGLEILGFPCNQFGAQEPGSSEEIASFCSLNYGVTFPMFAKIEVNGPNAHPLFAHLKAQAPGILGTEAIKWNFTKFLIDREGRVVERLASIDGGAKLRTSIEALLS